MLRRRARMPPVEMARILPREIVNLLERLGSRFAGRPARDMALWLACIPFVLPAPVIAGIIALSKRTKGDRDPRWRLVLTLSSANFLLSAAALAWIAALLGGWMAGHLDDFFGPLFFWPSDPGSHSIPV